MCSLCFSYHGAELLDLKSEAKVVEVGGVLWLGWVDINCVKIWFGLIIN